jgi:Transposase DDE domain
VDRDIWIVLACAARAACRKLGRPRRRFDFSDRLIILLWLWATLHDRPLCWACRPSSYGSMFRPRRLPSVSQLCKRLNTERFERAKLILHEILSAKSRDDLLSYLDGKALVINDYSTDPDARNGIASGKFHFGYKLHARATKSGFLPEYRVLSLNEGEPNTARELLTQLRPGSLVLADCNYDSRYLYRAVADRGSALLTRLKGRSRQSNNLRKMGPARRAALQTWQTIPNWCERAIHERDEVERIFAHLTSFGGGLGPLPPWVRRLSRVRRWVDAKIAIYHARLIVRQRTVAA